MASTMQYVENLALDDISSILTDMELNIVVLNGRIETYSFCRKERSHSSDKLNLKVKEEPRCAPLMVDTIFNENKLLKASVPPTLATIPSSPLSPKADAPSSSAAALSTLQTSPSALPQTNLPIGPILRRQRSGSASLVTTNSNKLKMERKPIRRRSNSLSEHNEPSTRRLLLDLISTLNESFPDYDFDKTRADQFVNQDVNTVIRNVNSHLSELTTKDIGGDKFLDKLWATVDDVMNIRKCEVFSYVSDMDGDPFSDGSLWSFNYFFVNQEIKQILYLTCVATSKLAHPCRGAYTSGQESGVDSQQDESDESDGNYEDEMCEDDNEEDSS